MMKKIGCFIAGVAIFSVHIAYAKGLAMTVSDPSPAIPSTVGVNITQPVSYYTVTSHINSAQPIGQITFSSASNSIATLTEDHCSNTRIAANGQCTFGVSITAGSSDLGATVIQHLIVPYGGSYPAVSSDYTVLVTGAATLSLSSGVVLKANDTTRTVTVTNSSSTYDAYNLDYTLTGNTSVSVSSNCSTLLHAGSGSNTCTLTITPPVSGAAAGAAAATGTITVQGSNAAAPTPATITVLDYANLYQTGYIYALSDNGTTVSGSIAGATDANSGVAVNWAGSAATCTAFGSGGSWAVPSICDLGQGTGPSPACTNPDNMFDRLYSLSPSIGGFSSTPYWSSTASGISAWTETFFGSGTQTSELKTLSRLVRCMRAIT